MTPADLAYTMDAPWGPILLMGFRCDLLEMTASWAEVHGHISTRQVDKVLEDTGDLFRFRDTAGHTWTVLKLVDVDVYNSRLRKKGDRKYPNLAALRAAFISTQQG